MSKQAKSLKKAEFLEHWATLEEDQQVNPRPVPYKHTGSTYDQDGIRITGSRQFVDSVLSRIKDLLVYEGSTTRLQVVYKQTVDRDTGQPLDAWNCYVQVHERGGQAKMANMLFGNVAQPATNGR